MSGPPRLPIHVGDYLKDTPPISKMNWEHHGIYFVMLLTAWNVPGCRLPDDDGWLSQRLGCSVPDVQSLVRPILCSYFKLRSKFWYQKRLSEEHFYVTLSSEKQAKRRKSGWDKRKTVNRGSTVVLPDGMSGSTPLPTPLPTPLAAVEAHEDETEFNQLHRLLAFDGQDRKNWLAFIEMKTIHGLDYSRHILPAAQHHAQSGKRGKVLAYIRPKAIEIRDHSQIEATAPVIFEDCDAHTWERRLETWQKLSAEWQQHWAGSPWPEKWGPIWTDPGTKVPANIVARFKEKLNGNGHAAK